MKSYIALSEMSVLDTPASWGYKQGTKGIYTSLFDFYGDTRESLDKLTNIMYTHKLFNFSNTGDYAGINNRNSMHFTFDDGQNSVTWLVSLFKTIADYNRVMGENISITLVKKDILEHGILDMSKDAMEDRISDDLADKYISLYVTRLKQILKRYRIDYILNTQVKEITNEKLSIVYKNNCFLIVPKNKQKGVES